MTARIIIPLVVVLGTSACRGDDASVPADTAEGSGSSVTAQQPAGDDDAPPVADTVSNADRALSTAVAMALVQSGDVDARHFDVRVESGVVELTSRSTSRREYDTARQLAASVPGVQQVMVATPPPVAGDEDAEGVPAPARDGMLEDSVALGTPRAEIPQLPTEQLDDNSLHRAASGDRPRTYRVRSGDSLSIIASRTMDDGNAWHRIYELNRSVIGPNPERLVEGMELRIPQD